MNRGQRKIAASGLFAVFTTGVVASNVAGAMQQQQQSVISLPFLARQMQSYEYEKTTLNNTLDGNVFCEIPRKQVLDLYKHLYKDKDKKVKEGALSAFVKEKKEVPSLVSFDIELCTKDDFDIIASCVKGVKLVGNFGNVIFFEITDFEKFMSSVIELCVKNKDVERVKAVINTSHFYYGNGVPDKEELPKVEVIEEEPPNFLETLNTEQILFLADGFLEEQGSRGTRQNKQLLKHLTKEQLFGLFACDIRGKNKVEVANDEEEEVNPISTDRFFGFCIYDELSDEQMNWVLSADDQKFTAIGTTKQEFVNENFATLKKKRLVSLFSSSILKKENKKQLVEAYIATKRMELPERIWNC